jgi:hypothetical protein
VSTGIRSAKRQGSAPSVELLSMSGTVLQTIRSRRATSQTRRKPCRTPIRLPTNFRSSSCLNCQRQLRDGRAGGSSSQRSLRRSPAVGLSWLRLWLVEPHTLRLREPKPRRNRHLPSASHGRRPLARCYLAGHRGEMRRHQRALVLPPPFGRGGGPRIPVSVSSRPSDMTPMRPRTSSRIRTGSRKRRTHRGSGAKSRRSPSADCELRAAPALGSSRRPFDATSAG